MVWGVNDWLIQARQLMNDPLLELLQGRHRSRVGGYELPSAGGSSPEGKPSRASVQTTAPELTLVELGQVLYNHLFQGTLRDSWMTAQGIAQHRGEMLRLRLGLKGGALPRLPWEVMYASNRDGTALHRPIATGTDVVFSRYQPGITMMDGRALPTLDPHQPIRILLAIAAPTDQERLELRREAMDLQQELQRPQPNSGEGYAAAPEFEVTVLDQPGREQLTQALEQGRFHILHYAGHSNLGVSGGNLYLVNPKTGLTEVLSGDDLAGLLVNNGIRMVVFNSCRGTHTAATANDTSPQERNLAEALVSRGIPAVLAMAEKIPDDVALTLTRLFYRNLKQGYPLDLSLSRARQGLISAYGSHQLYWALPVLYLHPECDGYLTLSDRTLVNPADRLLLLPNTYDLPPLLAGEALDESGTIPDDEVDDELEMLTRAVLLEDDITPLADAELSAAFGQMPTSLEPAHPNPAGHHTFFDDGSLEAATGDFTLHGLEDNETLDPNSAAALAAALMAETTPGEAAAGNGNGDGDGTAAFSTLLPLLPATPLPGRAASEQTTFGLAAVNAAGASRSAAQPGAIAPSTPGDTVEEELEIYPVDRSSTAFSSNGAGLGMGPAPAQPPSLIRRLYFVLPFLGAGVTALVLLALQSPPWLNSRPSPADLLPDRVQPAATQTPIASSEVETATPEQLATTATEHFQNQAIAAGVVLLEQLLDRNALDDAQTVLNTIPAEQGSDARILFLRGRLAWQRANAGHPDFAVDDAQRFWETAVSRQNDSPEYLNALGFAYYAQGKLGEAARTWCRTVSLNPSTANGSRAANATETVDPTNGNSCQVPTQPIASDASATAYAGIALALQQAALNPEEAQNQSIRLSQASNLYQLINLNRPTQFRPAELRDNWLWTDAAVDDWIMLSNR
jgi:hypothetical protein